MTAERKQKIERVLSLRQADLTVVLENVFDPHNISAIMRNCDAVGVGEIYVLNTKLPLHKEWGFKSSRSALKWVAVHQFSELEACMTAVKAKYGRIITTALTAGSQNLYEADLTGSQALVFGNEQNGISEEMAQWSDASITIPQVGMLHSLNISVACAVTLYEAFRQKTLVGHYSGQRITEEAYQHLSHQWNLSNENNS